MCLKFLWETQDGTYLFSNDLIRSSAFRFPSLCCFSLFSSCSCKSLTLLTNTNYMHTRIDNKDLQFATHIWPLPNCLGCPVEEQGWVQAGHRVPFKPGLLVLQGTRPLRFSNCAKPNLALRFSTFSSLFLSVLLRLALTSAAFSTSSSLKQNSKASIIF